MKKLTYMILVFAVVASLQSCSGSSSTDKADSANAAKMDTGMKDSTAVQPGTTVDENDAKFAVEAANGGMAEVALGKLALTKAKDANVKKFAEMMIADHTQANNELMALAKSKNITLPATVSEDKQKEADALAQKSGAEFDKAYVEMMIKDHEKTIELFKAESKDGKDQDIKTFVDKILPKLGTHLAHADNLNSSMATEK